MGMSWNTITVVLFVPQANPEFFLTPFLNVYDLMFVCVNLYTCDDFLLLISCMCECLYYENDYFSTYRIYPHNPNREKALDERF